MSEQERQEAWVLKREPKTTPHLITFKGNCLKPRNMYIVCLINLEPTNVKGNIGLGVDVYENIGVHRLHAHLNMGFDLNIHHV